MACGDRCPRERASTRLTAVLAFRQWRQRPPCRGQATAAAGRLSLLEPVGEWLREVGASIDAAEWVLLGELARGANQLKGKDRPMVLPADKLPTELRYPNQRFGVELAWDERGQPHVSPQAVPVFPPGHLASAGTGRRRADAPAAVGLRARPSARPQAQRDLPAWRPAVAAHGRGDRNAAGARWRTVRPQWTVVGSRSYGPQVKESHESSRDWNTMTQGRSSIGEPSSGSLMITPPVLGPSRSVPCRGNVYRPRSDPRRRPSVFTGPFSRRGRGVRLNTSD